MGLLFLDGDVTFDDYVRPAVIARGSGDVQQGWKCRISGWGGNYRGGVWQTPAVLQVAEGMQVYFKSYRGHGSFLFMLTKKQKLKRPVVARYFAAEETFRKKMEE